MVNDMGDNYSSRLLEDKVKYITSLRCTLATTAKTGHYLNTLSQYYMRSQPLCGLPKVSSRAGIDPLEQIALFRFFSFAL